jgi:hypothetical protein
MASILKVDQLTTTDGTSSATVANMSTLLNKPYAELAWAANGGAALTVANNNSTTKVPFSRSVYINQISADTVNYTWTHAQTGYYQLLLSYRQESGADIWTQYAVQKNSPLTLVGTSVRAGSANGGNPAHWNLSYYVDSTTANYSLYGWTNGTLTVRQTLDSTSSAWSAQTSDIIKIIITKIS